MLCIAAALFHKPGLTDVSDLGPIHDHLATLIGGGAALAFGIALIASGLSSSSVGTYAGQVVMAGFMNWRIPLFARRALTMLPALIVIGLAVNTTQALIYSQIVLSFGIPFALIPLLLITRTRETMTDMVNRRLTSTLMLLITARHHHTEPLPALRHAHQPDLTPPFGKRRRSASTGTRLYTAPRLNVCAPVPALR